MKKLKEKLQIILIIYGIYFLTLLIILLMQIYETTAALGYAQKAYLIRLNKTKSGYDYLCVGGENLHKQDNYEIGKVVKNLECFYVKESEFKIKDSLLHGSFLFDFFLKNHCA